MTDFKEGDEFWVIRTHSYHADPLHPSDIYLEKGIIGEDDDGALTGFTKYSFVTISDLDKCFKSKEEALDSMMARLNELRKK